MWGQKFALFTSMISNKRPMTFSGGTSSVETKVSSILSGAYRQAFDVGKSVLTLSLLSLAVLYAMPMPAYCSAYHEHCALHHHQCIAMENPLKSKNIITDQATNIQRLLRNDTLI